MKHRKYMMDFSAIVIDKVNSLGKVQACFSGVVGGSRKKMEKLPVFVA
jgi:hypothetical protein